MLKNIIKILCTGLLAVIIMGGGVMSEPEGDGWGTNPMPSEPWRPFNESSG